MTPIIIVSIVALVFWHFVWVISDMDGLVTRYMIWFAWLGRRLPRLLPKHLVSYSRKLTRKQNKRLIARTLKRVQAPWDTVGVTKHTYDNDPYWKIHYTKYYSK